jgi:hypothetical protein
VLKTTSIDKTPKNRQRLGHEMYSDFLNEKCLMDQPAMPVFPESKAEKDSE